MGLSQGQVSPRNPTHDMIAKFLRCIGFIVNCALMMFGVVFLCHWNSKQSKWGIVPVEMTFYLACGIWSTGLLLIFLGSMVSNIEALGLFDFYERFSPSAKWCRARWHLAIYYIWMGCMLWCGLFDLYGDWEYQAKRFGVAAFSLAGLNGLFAMFCQDSFFDEADDLPDFVEDMLEGSEIRNSTFGQFVRGYGIACNLCLSVLGAMCFIEFARRTEFKTPNSVFSAIAFSMIYLLFAQWALDREYKSLTKWNGSLSALVASRNEMGLFYVFFCFACMGGMSWPLFLANTDFWTWFSRGVGHAYSGLVIVNLIWVGMIKNENNDKLSAEYAQIESYNSV